MTSTNFFTTKIKIKGFYDIESLGSLIDHLEDCLNESIITSYEIIGIVIGDEDVIVEVFCHSDNNHTQDYCIDNIYCKVSAKFTDASIE